MDKIRFTLELDKPMYNRIMKFAFENEIYKCSKAIRALVDIAIPEEVGDGN